MAQTPLYHDTLIAKLLRDRRDALSYRKTQVEIARAMGYEHAANVSMFVTGRSALPLDRFMQAMDAFEIPQNEWERYFQAAIVSYNDNRIWGPLSAVMEKMAASK